MNKVVGVAVASLLLCGCRKAAPIHVTAAAPPKLSEGWTDGRSRDGKVSLGVAPGWRVGVDRFNDGPDLSNLGGEAQTTPSDSAAAAQLQQLTAEMDKQSKEMEAKALAALEKRGVVIQVINGGRPVFDEARTRYYVLRKHWDGTPGWAEATDWERRHYAFPPKPVEVKLPIGKAYRLSADDTLRNGSMRHEISYVAIEGQDVYVLRLITQEDASVVQSIADQVAQSWRIKPA